MNLALDLPVTNPVLIFAIAMITILLAPLLFERIRVPGIVGLIVVGAVIGPGGLGLLERSNTFILLGTVGLLYLMFVAGLSLDLNQFARKKAHSITFGLISFTLPAVLAVTLATSVLGYSLTQSFLAASIVGSHTLLAYPIVQRLGIVKNSAVTMTMGGTMVTDIVSLTILAIVVASAAGAIDAAFWIRFIGLSAVYTAAVLLILPRLGNWFFRSVRKQPDVEFVFLMAILFSGAFLAEAVGLAPIIGAFLVGLVMNRLVPSQSPLMTRISFVGEALFIPFFLLSVGLLVDLQVLVTSFQVWLLALLLTAMVMVGKMAAAQLVRLFFKNTSAESWLVFGLSTPQAAATLAVTLLGFEIGLLDSLFVNGVVVMILLTSLLGPWLVERFGRRVALEEETKPFLPTDAPQRILVPLANPETADELMQIAMMIRNSASQESIFPLSVSRSGDSADVASSEKLLSHAVVYAASADVPVTPVTRIDRNVASGISRAVKEQRISTVVVGWNGENTARAYIFGSILDQLLKETRESVIVCKIDRPINTMERILLAVPPYAEREPGFSQAIQAMKSFAEQSGADVVLLTTQAERERIDGIYAETRPEVTTRFHIIDAWSSLLDGFDTLAKEDDLLVLMNVREGSVAWRSTLNRLPRLISQRFAKNNFVINYISEAESRQLATTALSDMRARDGARAVTRIVEPTIVRPLEDDDDEVILRRMLGAAHTEEPSAYLEAVVIKMLSEDPDYHPELQPGVAFFHLHDDFILSEQLILGISPDGLKLSGTASPVYLVVILLVPGATRVEEYLRRLTVVAQLIPPPEEIDNLRRLESDESVKAFVQDRLGATASTLVQR